MTTNISAIELLKKGNELFLPSVSVDCVIFGFHQQQLKVLLLKTKYGGKWALPGGFIYKKEDVETAAARVLEERTQLKDIFLQQFHLFGQADRTRQKHAKELLREHGIENIEEHWISQRFVSVGFYALVEYAKVNAQPDEISTETDWSDIADLPDLIIDHEQIVKKALEAMRLHLNYKPIGYNLLPYEFTIKDLQFIYETILSKKLDRRNFQRKILSYGILNRREKHFTGAAHKAPYLYSFDKEKYFKALETGLEKDW